MGLKPDSRQTSMGDIPREWDAPLLGDLFTFKNGLNKAKQFFGHGTPIVNYMDVYEHRGLRLVDLRGCVSVNKRELDAYEVRMGDVFFTRTSETVAEVGMTAVMLDEPRSTVFSGFVLRARAKDDSLIDEYKQYCFSSYGVRRQITSQSVETTRALTNGRALSAVQIARPAKPEQRAIAQSLGEVDALIVSLEKLVAKKRDLEQAAMQQLLTGRTRLPGFGSRWEVKEIAQVATLSTERNTSAQVLPVLTCSKHRGFVDSLGYFKNQVFSEDTSTYRIIRRGAIGYPSNHVEEGSIGLQELYDVALVSPIYVVFSVHEEVNSYFLHRLLKLDSYRQKFKTATTSSVDRRGSLRWPAFSGIAVTLPERAEQDAIAAVLGDMDAEFEAQEKLLAKTRDLKQGMMQELLTGRTRLV